MLPDKSKVSPMMKQYMDIKEKYPDHILFFRLGDFYEMFFDDALTASKVLELTLTGRDCGLEERAPMCGVPYHSSEIYIKRLINAGYKVAICEQLTDPNESKGIVIRDVVRIVTPGTLTESSMLEDDTNNYICSAYFRDKECGLCFSDISTGETVLYLKSGKDFETEVTDEISRYNPAEIVFNADFLKLKSVTSFIKQRLKCAVTLRDDECFDSELKEEQVLKQFSVSSYEELGVEPDSTECGAVCGMFDYIFETQRTLVGRFTSIDIKTGSGFMGLDLTARRNLELTETLRNKERRGSLLWVLDATETSMGKRLLRKWIEQPLTNQLKIIERLDATEQLYRKSVVMFDINELFGKVYDIERLMTRVMYGTANPRDIKALETSAKQLPQIKKCLEKVSGSKLLAKLNNDISELTEISNLISNSINDEPPVSLKDGGVIKDGFNARLDELRNIMNNGETIIKQIEDREKEATGIKGLKIGNNKVFGYYIEVTRSYYNLVPPHYVRKQTLANCERFITDELKKTENDIVNAKEKSLAIENEIFSEIKSFISSKLSEVQKTAEALAQVDVLCSFALIARKNMYVKPEITLDGSINIIGGRHPVVEQMMNEEMFVPNNAYLDTKANRMAIITGPNMSGKSTFMRQTALIVIMAQMGCFVPAESARISVVDKIFTRIGASDDLTAGQSTFMVEMSEVAEILKHATKKSLVILDEVGRGTSTFDGISIAKSVAEYICNNRKLGCKTLFATHYHELTELENQYEGIKNLSVAVKKHGDNIRFLRKIVEGGADDSYGIEVAKLAGLPDKVIERAKELLEEMEMQAMKPVKERVSENMGQTDFSDMGKDIIIRKLKKLNVAELTDEECREVLEDFEKFL